MRTRSACKGPLIALALSSIVSSAESQEVPHFGLPPVTTSKADEVLRCLPKTNVKRLLPGLSPFWAQEYIGADLAKKWLAEAEHLKPRQVRIGTFESLDFSSIDKAIVSQELARCQTSSEAGCANEHVPSKENFQVPHGAEMFNLIADPLVGVATSAQLVATGNGLWNGVPSVGLVDNLLKSRAELECSSVGESSDVLAEPGEYARINEKNIVRIRATGNEYAEPQYKHPRVANAVLVGSLSPIGLISYFSNHSEQVQVFAPSDNYVLSKQRGKLSVFGGTSGAQPLVCGALANVIALLPGLTMDEARILLSRTATPVPGLALESKAGMLNALRLARVAGRLAKFWPSQRELIQSSASLYDFRQDAQTEWDAAKHLFGQSDACAKSRGLEHLRAAWLLDPTQNDYGARLGAEYKKVGLTLNAIFFDLETAGISPKSLRELRQQLHQNDFRATLLRALSHIEDPARINVLMTELRSYLSGDVFSKVNKFVGIDIPNIAAYRLVQLGHKREVEEEFLRSLTQGKHVEQGDILVKASNFEMNMEPFLKECTQKPSWICIRLAVDNGAFNLLEPMMKTSRDEVKSMIIQNLKNAKSPATEEVLKEWAGKASISKKLRDEIEVRP